MRFREIQQKFWRENTRTGQLGSVIKYKKLSPGMITLQKNNQKSTIEKVFPGLIAPKEQLKVSLIIAKKIFLG